MALFIFMDIGLADDPKALDGLILKYKLNTSAYVSVEKANFRSAPNGKITRQLTRGTTVMPIEKVDNSWWKVQLQDGTIGFLHKTVFKTEVSKVVTNKVMAILLLIAPYAVALLVLIRDISKRRQPSVSPSPDHINHRIYDTL